MRRATGSGPTVAGRGRTGAKPLARVGPSPTVATGSALSTPPPRRRQPKPLNATHAATHTDSGYGPFIRFAGPLVAHGRGVCTARGASRKSRPILSNPR